MGVGEGEAVGDGDGVAVGRGVGVAVGTGVGVGGGDGVGVGGDTVGGGVAVTVGRALPPAQPNATSSNATTTIRRPPRQCFFTLITSPLNA